MKISLGYLPKDSPWGGGNQFSIMFKEYFMSRGYIVVHTLDSDSDVAILIDPRPGGEKTFIHTDILKFKRKNLRLKVLHRINECDKRKRTHFMDRLLYKANQCADFTVFISSWLKDYFMSEWPEYNKPYAVINNGADENIFNNINKRYWDGNEPLKIVTHHWSDNPMKGIDIYQKLDGLLNDPEMKKIFSFIYVGRHPQGIKFKNTLVVEPRFGRGLAEELKTCHVYLTASRFEPCGMHHIEGALCGLPLLCINEGGGAVECCQNYGIIFDKNTFASSLFEMRDRYNEFIIKLKDYSFTSTIMLQKYEDVIIKLVA